MNATGCPTVPFYSVFIELVAFCYSRAFMFPQRSSRLTLANG